MIGKLGLCLFLQLPVFGYIDFVLKCISAYRRCETLLKKEIDAGH